MAEIRYTLTELSLRDLIPLKAGFEGYLCLLTSLSDLLQSDTGDSVEVTRNVEQIVVKIIGVFVDALPHVPEHRRLPILVQLVTTLSAKKFLWILLVLLFEQYVTKTVLVAAYGEKVRAYISQVGW
jgi:hypothetical protein